MVNFVMPADPSTFPRSLNLTEVCYKVSKKCLDSFSCDRVIIILQDEYGWRVYKLLTDGEFQKLRLKNNPKKKLKELSFESHIVELESSTGVMGWIVLTGISGGLRTNKFFERLKEELPEWLDRVRKYRKARRQAVKDGLTDLFNYRYFMEVLQKEIENAKKFCSLIVMDVDDFKKYNDHFGHLKGSALLQEIATILRRSSGSGNLVAKYGGDEFAVILPEISKEEAFLIAQGVRYRIERHKFHGEEKSQPNQILTVSGGVATHPIDAKDAFTLFDQADHAMYEAKRKGKNRIMYLS